MTCVTEQDYQNDVLPILKNSYDQLMQAGKLLDKKFDPETGALAKIGAGDLQWPLRMADNYVAEPGVYDYFQIWNYADLNTAEGIREDWNCNTGDSARNYDNHNGADIVPLPFRWNMMEMGYVDVVAAADGEILFLDDGNFDRNCAAPHVMGDYDGYGHYGNFVAILHADNSVTLYGHMKSGTVVDFEPGTEVVAGQYLGKVGSSGNSSDPHLHFEVRECLECPYFEPWYDVAGCNTAIDASWWADQRPYNETQVLRVMTHSGYPDYFSCGSYEAGINETVKERNHFASGSSVYVGVYMRDLLNGDGLNVNIYNSSNVIQKSWSVVASDDYNYGYEFNNVEVMTGDPDGTYRLAAIHDGKTYNHYFTIGCTPSYTLFGSHTGFKGYIAGDFITSTASIAGLSTNEVLYEAENYVLLNPGFVATANSDFQARINDCTVPGAKEEAPIQEISGLQVFPNPTDGRATLQINNTLQGTCTIRIVNLQGDIIALNSIELTGNSVVYPIDLSTSAKGMYLIQVEFPGGRAAEQIVIQ